MPTKTGRSLRLLIRRMDSARTARDTTLLDSLRKTLPDSLQSVPLDTLLEMGLATGDPAALDVLRRGADACGIPEDQVEAAIASQFG